MPRLKSKCSINIWQSVSLPQVNTLGFGDLHVCLQKRTATKSASLVAVLFTFDIVFGNAGAKWGCFSIMRGVEILFKRIMFTCVVAWHFLAYDSWTKARPLWSYHHGKSIAHISHYH